MYVYSTQGRLHLLKYCTYIPLTVDMYIYIYNTFSIPYTYKYSWSVKHTY